MYHNVFGYRVLDSYEEPCITLGEGMYFKIDKSTKRFVFFKFIYLFCSYIRVCLNLVAFVRGHIWHKALLMGNSMRLELIRVYGLNDFQLIMV